MIINLNDVDFDEVLNCKLLNSDYLDIASDRDKPYLERITALSKHWKLNEKEVVDYGNKFPRLFIVSYLFDYSSIFTPIESMAWSSIRRIGTIPFYPQYPVLKYISDFANPYFKIIIELDGEDYHKDKQKDLLRDLECEKGGWSVIRIPGELMYRIEDTDYHDKQAEYELNNIYEEDYFDFLDSFYSNTGEGIFLAIRKIFTDKSFNYNRETLLAVNSILSSCTAGKDRLNELIYKQLERK